MVDSLKAIGQQTIAKVRRLTEEEKASYSYFNHEWGEDSKAPKKTNGEFGFEYMVIGGHRRLAGAKLAGFETLDCVILDIAPEDTHLASLLDNSNVEMSWWDWDLAIEKEQKLHPKLTQRELADRLGISKSKVNRALKILAVIDSFTRGTIDCNLDKAPLHGDVSVPARDKTPDEENDLVPPRDKTEPVYEITESILLALTDLDDPDLMSLAIEIMIDFKMPAGSVKKVMEYVKNGGQPEDFDPKKNSNGQNKGEDPFAMNWKGLNPAIKVKHKGGEGYEIRLAVTGGQKALEIAQGAHRSLEGGIVGKLTKFLNEAGNS